MYKILIADDHPLFREAIHNVISDGFAGSEVMAPVRVLAWISGSAAMGVSANSRRAGQSVAIPTEVWRKSRRFMAAGIVTTNLIYRVIL